MFNLTGGSPSLSDPTTAKCKVVSRLWILTFPIIGHWSGFHSPSDPYFAFFVLFCDRIYTRSLTDQVNFQSIGPPHKPKFLPQLLPHPIREPFQWILIHCIEWSVIPCIALGLFPFNYLCSKFWHRFRAPLEFQIHIHYIPQSQFIELSQILPLKSGPPHFSTSDHYGHSEERAMACRSFDLPYPLQFIQSLARSPLNAASAAASSRYNSSHAITAGFPNHPTG